MMPSRSLQRLSLIVGALGLTGVARAQSPGEFTVSDNLQVYSIDNARVFSGESNPIPADDLAFESGSQRNALVVYGGGTLELLNGAAVSVANASNTAFLRVGYGTAGSLTVKSGATLDVGTATRYANFHIGQGIGAVGSVLQEGGTVTTIGSFNVGVNGGTGTYRVEGGSLVFDHAGATAANRTTLVSLGFNNSTAGTSSGRMEIAGGLVELKDVQPKGEGEQQPAVNFIIGNRAMDALAVYGGGAAGAGNGELAQTGGVFRVGSGAALFLSGYGNGSYQLNGGALEIGGDSLRAQYGNHAGYTYDFGLGGGTIRVIGSNLTTDVDISINDLNPTSAYTQSFIDTNGLNATFSGKLTGAGTLVKTGLGTLTLAGANNITGEAYVIGGAIGQIAGNSSIRYLAVASGPGATGDYDLSGGTLNVAHSLQVGDWGGAGAFNQTGGTVNVNGSFNVGNQGGTGTYNLSAGTLNLSGGLYNLGRNTDTKPASSGTFNLSGTGVLDVKSGNFIIGNRDATAINGNGAGVFNQTGGVLRFSGTNAGADSLFISAYGAGEYNLLGGALEIGSDHLRGNYSGGAAYAFNLGGGTIKVIGTALTTSVNASLVDGTASFIDTNGLGATWSGAIDGAGAGLVKYGAGTFTLAGNATREVGSFFVAGGVAAQTNGASIISEFAVGTGAGNSGEFIVNGGVVTLAGQAPFDSPGSAASFRVGDFGGTGVFTQNGGTVRVGSASELAALNIGNQGGHGTYNLNGGTLELSGGINVIGRSHGANPASTGVLNIAGSSALLEIKNGSSLIVGNNATRPEYGTGTVNQSAGTVRVSDGALFVSGFGAGAYNLTGGTLEVGGDDLRARYNNTTSSSTFNFGGGTIKVINENLVTDVRALLAEGSTSTVNTNGFNATFSAGLGGPGAFTKTGEGVLTLAGVTDIGKVASGTWTPTISSVNQGTLRIAGDATVRGILAANGAESAFGAAKTAGVSLGAGASLKIGDGVSPGSYLLVGYGQTGEFSMTGGTLAVTGVDAAPFPGSGIAIGDANGRGRFSLSGGTVDLEDGPRITNLSVGTGGGTGGFVQTGGTVELGSNFSVGTGQGSEGSYALSGSAVLNAQRSAGSTIIYVGNDGGSGSLEIGGAAQVNLGAGSSVWIGGIQSAARNGSTGTVTQTGGTFTFAGNYFQLGGRAGDTGTYNLNGGTFAIGGANAISAGAGVANFNLGGGIFKVLGSDFTTAVRATLVADTVSTINTNGLNATFANGLAGTGGFSKTGAGALALNGATDLQSSSTVRGVLKVGAGAGRSGTLNLSDGLTVLVTDGAGRLQVGVDGGSGTANFKAGSSFTIDDSAASGGWGTLDVGRGANSTGVVNHDSGAVALSGGALQIGYSGGEGAYHLSGDATLTLGENSSVFIGSGAGASGALTIADQAVFASDSQIFVGAGAGSVGRITQNGANSSAVFSGPILSFGTDSDETVNSPGSGSYELAAGSARFEAITQGVRVGDSAHGGSGAFNQSGGTATFADTVLRVGAHGSYNQSGGVLEIGGNNLTGAGAFNLGGGTIKVAGSKLTTGINATLTSGKTLTIDTNGLGALFSGSLTGAGGLNKIGAGVLHLTGESDYAGVTQVSAGVLRVDGVLGGSLVNVASGATLAGHGTIADVHVFSGGALSVGESLATLTVTGDLTLDSGSLTLLRIGGGGPGGHDALKVGGTLFAGGSLEIVLLDGFNPLDGASFTLFDATNIQGAFTISSLPSLTAGLEWDLAGLHTDGVLAVQASAIPEPSTVVWWTGIAVLMVSASRRKPAKSRCS